MDYNTSYYIFYLKNILNQGVASDDNRFSDEMLYFLLLNIRATLISQKHKKNQKLSDFNYLDIPCIKLSLSTIDECDCVPADLGCKYMRSDIEIPEILMGRNKFLGYATDMYGNNIDIVDFQSTRYDKLSFTKKDSVKAFIRNKKLFIVNNTDLERVSLTAIFYDPHQLALIDCGEPDLTVCFDPLTQPFPMEKDLSDALFKMSYDDFVKYSMKIPQDKTNNAANPQ